MFVLLASLHIFLDCGSFLNVEHHDVAGHMENNNIKAKDVSLSLVLACPFSFSHMFLDEDLVDTKIVADRFFSICLICIFYLPSITIFFSIIY